MKKIFYYRCYPAHLFSCYAQTSIHRDPLIEKMVNEVSRDSLESYIKKLVKFWEPGVP
jgi:hypothetical protein